MKLLRSARLERNRSILARRDAIDSFSVFVEQSWPVIEPAVRFVPNWHIDAIAEHLEAVSRGEIKRLLVNMPPRHAKSTLISVMWPMWSWLHNPSLQWLCASYGLDLAIGHNRKARILISSQWFGERYGSMFRLTSDQNVKSRFENDKRGYRMAVSVGSAVTGEGGSALLIDDPHPADDAHSDAQRQSTLQWFDETWPSRLNDQETGFMVVVGQRIHQLDVSGRILELGGWEHINLPTEFEEVSRCRTSLGWSDPRTEEGELLWPQRFSAAIIARLKKQYGPIAYASQFQQMPMPSGGGQFRREWFRYFSETNDAYLLETSSGTKSILKYRCSIFVTVDLAISSKQSADYTVFAVWAVTAERDLLLVDVIRARLSNPEQLKQLRLLRQQWRGTYFKIEATAYQSALIQQGLAEGIACKEYNPAGRGDKPTRAIPASIWMENGKIYWRKGAAWLSDFETELLLFPKAAHDDQVDCVSMAADEVTGHDDLGALDDDVAGAISSYRGY